MSGQNILNSEAISFLQSIGMYDEYLEKYNSTKESYVNAAKKRYSNVKRCLKKVIKDVDFGYEFYIDANLHFTCEVGYVRLYMNYHNSFDLLIMEYFPFQNEFKTYSKYYLKYDKDNGITIGQDRNCGEYKDIPLLLDENDKVNKNYLIGCIKNFFNELNLIAKQAIEHF